MIIPDSTTCDQRTMTLLLEHDPLVQRSRAFFALFDWRAVPEPIIDPRQPGKRPHPQSAYVKALLLKISEGLTSCTQLRRFLLDHPLVVLELGFRPVLNWTLPYGFDVGKTLPTARWLRQQQHTLPQPVLQDLLAATVRDLCEEMPGLGEVVADARDSHLRLCEREQSTRLCQRTLPRKSSNPQGIPIASWGSSAVPTKSKPMAPRKKRKNTCGAPAWPVPQWQAMGMWCWPKTP